MKKVIAVITGALGFIFLLIGFIMKPTAESRSISIIGGADGPTSIFLAGKMGTEFSWIGIGVGAVLLFLAVLLAVRIKSGRNSKDE